MSVRFLTGLFSMLCAAAVVPAEPAAPTGQAKSVNVANFASPDSPTAGIQEAVDALPAEGGVVAIPAGEYALRQGIVLRSDVTLRGAGPTTILRKTKHAESKLAAIAQQGSRSVQVASAAGFAAGDQVAIRDKDGQGANVMRAIVQGVQGNELLLDRPLSRTFDPTKSGFVIHMFPAITAEKASNIVIKDLAIKDGAVRDLSVYGPVDPRSKLINWPMVLPFHLAAIHLNYVGDSRVEGVSVSGWLSDGISVQGGTIKGPSGGSTGNNTVTGCTVEKVAGIGLHPGGGLHDSLFSHNISRGNGIHGLYFCSAVERVTVSENQFLGNKVDGVTGLGDFGDKFNTVSKNVISDNGRYGVGMTDGDSNTVVDNTVANNSQAEPGKHSGIYVRATSKSTIKGNRCFDDQQKKTQKYGIEESADCRENAISDNDCHGNAQGDIILAKDQPPAPAVDTSPRSGRAGAGSRSVEQSAAAPDSVPTRRRGSVAPATLDQPQAAGQQEVTPRRPRAAAAPEGDQPQPARRGRGAAGSPPAEQPAASADSAPRRRPAPPAPEGDQPPPAGRNSETPRGVPSPAAPPAVQAKLAVPLKVGPAEIVDYTDPTYGSKIRQLKKDDGHEHNLYYYRDPWNADGSRMLGIQSDQEQKNWHVVLYDGDGRFIKDLFSISQYDWRLCWDRNDPDILYTSKGPDLYRFHVQAGKAESMKSFEPLTLGPSGPSVNQAGDRILVVTSDRVFHSYHLPDMSGERIFKMNLPKGYYVSWDKPHYIGYRNYIDTAYRAADLSEQAIVVYDDTGEVVHKFDSIGGGGHYDWSPDGKLAYFKLPTGGRGRPETPLEIHVVNLDGSGDRILFGVPRAKAHFTNLHLSWPRKVNDWFVAGFYPAAAALPPRGAAAHYEPPLDEILLVRLNGTTRYLARTETAYSSGAGRGRLGDMFWAQPLPRPSADGKRIVFNSNRSGTIDQCILYTAGDPHAQPRQ